MENYHVLDLIGEGSYGKVYKGRRKYTGQVVALKFISKTKKPEKEVKNLRREIDIMRTLHHPNIVEMLDSFDTPHDIVVVTEFAQGELFQILTDDRTLPQEQVQSIAAQLVSALYYLHARRILHRDMKPQNILLGKDGVVKLCDFGFARAMSYNTLVLTSIKGTPLYMSPELIMEQPYDHTADLWALACILYELCVGEPPFCAEGLYQLINMVVHRSVRWSSKISPVLRDFLERLLVKNPRLRLSWPELLEHPYIRDIVIVSAEDKNLQSPFTQAPTASLIIEKEKQVKERAIPPGSSKLRRYRERPEPTPPEKEQKAKVVAWASKPEDAVPAVQAVQSASQTGTARASSNSPTEIVEPTPRPDRINHDYSKEFPNVEIENQHVAAAAVASDGRRSSATKTSSNRKNFDSVKLNEEDADSDDEWQALIEATDCETQKTESVLAVMNDKTFVTKLKSRFGSSSAQVLEAVLEGASRLRPVLQIISNLVTLKCDAEALCKFMLAVEIPDRLLKLIEQILQNANVKLQPWCQQILIDLVHCLHAFFSSAEIVLLTASTSPSNGNAWTSEDVTSKKPDVSKPAIQNQLPVYSDAAIQFGGLVQKLTFQKFDVDLRLREHTLLCFVYCCELMDHCEVARFFDTIADSASLLESLLHCCILDEQAVKGLETISGGEDTDLVHQRIEDNIMLGITSITSLVYPQLTVAVCQNNLKANVAGAFGKLMCQQSVATLTSDYLLLLSHPGTCSTIVKALYGIIQSSSEMCKLVANSQREVQTLIEILQGKMEMSDADYSVTIEATLHLVSQMVVQLGSVSEHLETAAPVIASIFVEPQFPSHAAAAAYALCQMSGLGVITDLQPEDLTSASLLVLAELSQVFVRWPLGIGVLDGPMCLLSQAIAQAELVVNNQLIANGMWSVLWQRIAQTVRIDINSSESQSVLQDIDDDQVAVQSQPSQVTHRAEPPDWSLLSFKGLNTALGIGTSIFAKESSQLMDCLTKPDDIVMLTLVHLVSPSFLRQLNADTDAENIAAVVTQVTQILCLPFAVDAGDQVSEAVYSCYAACGLVDKLFYACMKHLNSTKLDLPVGLVNRLILSDVKFIQQFLSSVDKHEGSVQFLSTCVMASETDTSTVVMCEVLSLCSHLARTSSKHLPLLMRIFEGKKRDYRPLELLLAHNDASVRSRTCSLLGNILKHSAAFYDCMADRPLLLKNLSVCLLDYETDVRKSASYAVGNAAFHNGQLYSGLQGSIPHLVKLLSDPSAKIRANAAGAIGNLAVNSADLCKKLLQEKAVASLLDTACHDSQSVVQETAVAALRTIATQPILRQELRRLNAVDRLRAVSRQESGYHTASPSPRVHSSASYIGNGLTAVSNSMSSQGRQSPAGGKGLAHQRTSLIRILSSAS